MIHVTVQDPIRELSFTIHQTKMNGKFFVWTKQIEDVGGDFAVIAHSESSSERLCANACQRQWDLILKNNPASYTSRSITEYATGIRSTHGTYLIYNAGGMGFSVIKVPEKTALDFMTGSRSWATHVPHDLQETANGMIPVDKDAVCVVEDYARALEICLEGEDDIPDFNGDTQMDSTGLKVSGDETNVND